VNLYAESSAVLAWLLGETSGEVVRDALARSELVLTSDVTLVECDRVLHRAAASGLLAEGDAAERRAFLTAAAARWHRLHLTEQAVERARRPFPREPLRTLDALHLASALEARAAVPALALLSLDQRVRSNGEMLGFSLIPR
jgi:predicted nucleic acid-binding protein